MCGFFGGGLFVWGFWDFVFLSFFDSEMSITMLRTELYNFPGRAAITLAEFIPGHSYPNLSAY